MAQSSVTLHGIVGTSIGYQSSTTTLGSTTGGRQYASYRQLLAPHSPTIWLPAMRPCWAHTKKALWTCIHKALISLVGARGFEPPPTCTPRKE
jgi:hypothetical protein